MRKAFKYFVMLTVALTSLSLASCSKDDDPSGGGNAPSTSSIIGSWELDMNSGYGALIAEMGELYGEGNLYEVFKKDGTGYEIDVNGEDVEVEKINYTTSENNFKIKYEGGHIASEGTYKIEKDILTFYMTSPIPVTAVFHKVSDDVVSKYLKKYE